MDYKQTPNNEVARVTAFLRSVETREAHRQEQLTAAYTKIAQLEEELAASSQEAEQRSQDLKKLLNEQHEDMKQREQSADNFLRKKLATQFEDVRTQLATQYEDRVRQLELQLDEKETFIEQTTQTVTSLQVEIEKLRTADVFSDQLSDVRAQLTAQYTKRIQQLETIVTERTQTVTVHQN